MDMGIRRTLACALAGVATTLTLLSPAATAAPETTGSTRSTAPTAVAPRAAAPRAPAEPSGELTWTKQTPQLTGAKRVGTRLRIRFAFTTGFSPAANRLYFEWRRWNEPIAGAAGPDHRTYDLKRADRNANIVCVVYGYRGDRTGMVRSNVVKVART